MSVCVQYDIWSCCFGVPYPLWDFLSVRHIFTSPSLRHLAFCAKPPLNRDICWHLTLLICQHKALFLDMYDRYSCCFIGLSWPKISRNDLFCNFSNGPNAISCVTCTQLTNITKELSLQQPLSSHKSLKPWQRTSLCKQNKDQKTTVHRLTWIPKILRRKFLYHLVPPLFRQRHRIIVIHGFLYHQAVRRSLFRWLWSLYRSCFTLRHGSCLRKRQGMAGEAGNGRPVGKRCQMLQVHHPWHWNSQIQQEPKLENGEKLSTKRDQLSQNSWATSLAQKKFSCSWSMVYTVMAKRLYMSRCSRIHGWKKCNGWVFSFSSIVFLCYWPCPHVLLLRGCSSYPLLADKIYRTDEAYVTTGPHDLRAWALRGQNWY